MSNKMAVWGALGAGLLAANIARADLLSISQLQVYDLAITLPSGAAIEKKTAHCAGDGRFTDDSIAADGHSGGRDRYYPIGAAGHCRGSFCMEFVYNGFQSMALIDDPDSSGPIAGLHGSQGSGDESVEQRLFALGNAAAFLGNEAQSLWALGADSGFSLPEGLRTGAQSKGVGRIGATLRVGPHGGAIGFSFNAEIFLAAFASRHNAYPPTSANATATFEITLTNDANAVVFAWSPNGSGADPLGGKTLMDDINLNAAVTADRAGDWYRYAPMQGFGGSCGGDGVCGFAAVTGWLPPGVYSLSIRTSASGYGEQRDASARPIARDAPERHPAASGAHPRSPGAA